MHSCIYDTRRTVHRNLLSAVLAIVLTGGVALVLLENGYRPLLEVWLDHGRHWLLYYILPAIRLEGYRS
jgi:hypothetical protein